MINGKKWFIIFIITASIVFILIGTFVVVVDPYFHFHSPLEELEYPINYERYQNDGIVRNFEYDAIITGTSMTQNFKTSECNEIFGVNSIKVPFSASSLKETNDLLKRALKANPNVKLIIRSLEASMLKADKDLLTYSSYPTYLTDYSLLNDINYALNKKAFLSSIHVLLHTLNGKNTTSFDSYANWAAKSTFGKTAVLNNYSRPKKASKEAEFNDVIREKTLGNLKQNVLEIAEQYPSTQFYYFMPPFSIVYWDDANQDGILKLYIELYKFATELMLEYDNIHIFSFYDEYDMITNLDNYTDPGHYHESINTQMLYWMGNGEHELTKDNYEEYWNKIYKYFVNYDYDSIFED